MALDDLVTFVYNKVHSLKGFLPGIVNFVEKDADGISIAGLTVVGGNAKGFYAGLIGNQVDGDAEGFYIGMGNAVSGYSNGVYIGVTNPTACDAEGLYIGASNVVYGNAKGVYIGIINQAEKIKPAKIKFRKWQITLPAIQVGICNFARKAEGPYLQFGIANFIGKRFGMLVSCGIGYDLDLPSYF